MIVGINCTIINNAAPVKKKIVTILLVTANAFNGLIFVI